MPYMSNMAQQGGIVAPNQIPDLNLWYDASVTNAAYMQTSSSIAPTNGQAIKSWLSKTGVGRNADQATPNRQPIWRANQQNGLGALQFDGVNDVLTLNPLQSWALSLPGQTTYTVIKLAGQADLMSVHATNTSGYKFNLSGNYWAVETGGGVAVSDALNDTSNYHYLGMIFDGSQTNANTTTQNNARVKFRYDGIQRALTFSANANTSTSASANTLNVGADASGSSNFLNGYIGEMMIWTRTLSATEISQVEAYLKSKWNI